LILWQLSDDAPGCYSPNHFYGTQDRPQTSCRQRDEDYPWFQRELMAGRITRFSSLEELPAEAARDRESFLQLGTKLFLDDVVLGGGNAKRLTRLPFGCRIGDNANALLGGFRLWEEKGKQS